MASRCTRIALFLINMIPCFLSHIQPSHDFNSQSSIPTAQLPALSPFTTQTASNHSPPFTYHSFSPIFSTPTLNPYTLKTLDEYIPRRNLSHIPPGATGNSKPSLIKTPVVGIKFTRVWSFVLPDSVDVLPAVSMV